jgi:hypothetical protein
MIQLILAIVAVSLALFFLGKKFYRNFFGADACDGCAVSKLTERKAD